MVAQIISYEIPLVISLLVPCILIGSLNFQEIINYQDGSWIVFYLNILIVIKSLIFLLLYYLLDGAFLE